MSDFLDKISSYNLFNYLFPGVVFCIIADNFFSYSLLQEDIVIGVFLYYFIGLLISRLGSLIIEPFLKWIRFVEFADYSKFIEASKNDPKIETLSEVNNMYRTIVSLFLALLLLCLYGVIKSIWPGIAEFMSYLLIVLLLLIFLLSYKKQTKYIKYRIDINSG